MNRIATPPTTTDEAAALVRDLVVHQVNLEKAIAVRDGEINLIREKYAQSISDAETSIKICEEMLALFAANNPGLFEDRKSTEIDSQVIGYSTGKWKVATEDDVTEDDVVTALKEIIQLGEKPNASGIAVARAEWAKFFIRTKVSLNKDRMLEESERPEILAFLGEIGVYFTKEDKFFIRPARKGQKAAKLVSKLN